MPGWQHADVPPRRRIDPAAGTAAVAAWRRNPSGLSRADLATAVRFTLQALADAAPGRSVEVRVPPHAAAQCVPGPRHTRGTPPNVVEMDADTWLALVTGGLGWADGVRSGRVSASGERADLSAWLPLQVAASAVDTVDG